MTHPVKLGGNAVRHLGHWHDVLRTTRMERRARHAIDGGALPILSHSSSTGFTNLSQAFRSIPTDSGEHHADCSRPKHPGHTPEGRIGRWTDAPDRWLLVQRQTEPSRRWAHPHVEIS